MQIEVSTVPRRTPYGLLRSVNPSVGACFFTLTYIWPEFDVNNVKPNQKVEKTLDPQASFPLWVGIGSWGKMTLSGMRLPTLHSLPSEVSPQVSSHTPWTKHLWPSFKIFSCLLP